MAPLFKRRGPFSPPLAMQQSIWDSITDGNFIDAKVFAYSRRARGSGRVHTPKALFVNAHVLASACGYFRSSTPSSLSKDILFIIPIAFDLSNGIETSLAAGLPPGLDPAIDVNEDDLDGDYEFAEECPADKGPIDAEVISRTRAPQVLPERTVKAYLVRCTAYRTFVRDFRSPRCPLMEV